MHLFWFDIALYINPLQWAQLSFLSPRLLEEPRAKILTRMGAR